MIAGRVLGLVGVGVGRGDARGGRAGEFLYHVEFLATEYCREGVS